MIKEYKHNKKGFIVKATKTNKGFYLFKKPGSVSESSLSEYSFEEKYSLLETTKSYTT